MSKFTKIVFAILNTLLAISLCFGFAFSLSFSYTNNAAVFYNALVVVLLSAVVAGWVVALKRSETISVWWKRLSFSAVALFVLAGGLHIIANMVSFPLRLLLSIFRT